MIDTSVRQQDATFSVSEVASVLNVSKMTVYRHIQSGRLEAERVGGSGSYRVTAGSLRRILEDDWRERG